MFTFIDVLSLAYWNILNYDHGHQSAHIINIFGILDSFYNED